MRSHFEASTSRGSSCEWSRFEKMSCEGKRRRAASSIEYEHCRSSSSTCATRESSTAPSVALALSRLTYRLPKRRVVVEIDLRVRDDDLAVGCLREGVDFNHRRVRGHKHSPERPHRFAARLGCATIEPEVLNDAVHLVLEGAPSRGRVEAVGVEVAAELLQGCTM